MLQCCVFGDEASAVGNKRSVFPCLTGSTNTAHAIKLAVCTVGECVVTVFFYQYGHSAKRTSLISGHIFFAPILSANGNPNDLLKMQRVRSAIYTQAWIKKLKCKKKVLFLLSLLFSFSNKLILPRSIMDLTMDKELI